MDDDDSVLKKEPDKIDTEISEDHKKELVDLEQIENLTKSIEETNMILGARYIELADLVNKRFSDLYGIVNKMKDDVQTLQDDVKKHSAITNIWLGLWWLLFYFLIEWIYKNLL